MNWFARCAAMPGEPKGGPAFPATALVDRLAHGELPGIALGAARDRGAVLRTYAYVYLEEELRREALIKDWPAFARFLRLAALDTVLANPGPLLEQWVGIELHKRLAYSGKGRLSYLRSKAGTEIDFIVEQGKNLVPIEVTWTDNPSRGDARHLIPFLAEHGARAPRG